ncbi:MULTISPECIES: zinc ribbon domain-containing protein [unclassified Frankia]|uniref:zinc ribbon domain-containing protein n=1 Tax=unclassified Frankia TaxID=2632575 RepID=UPI002AD2BE46|nr:MULTISPECIES: zinc ribbon domain-containing protein [unclassified Frankia]
MANQVPFTNNYRDLSTREGYQYEFSCLRCGNGYKSAFRHSVTGFGGRIATIGGRLLGGNMGNRIADAGWNAEWLRDSTAGSTNDRMLRAAVEEVSPSFQQCHRCGQWVCKQVCWNGTRGLCVTCAPKVDQEIAARQASAQVQQIDERVRQVDWTDDLNLRDRGTGLCSGCGQESGGGRFCAHCGTALAAARPSRFCVNCGSGLGPGVSFCGECGTTA